MSSSLLASSITACCYFLNAIINFSFKWVLSLVYLIYWLLITAVLIAYMGYVLASWVLPRTPEWIVVMMIVGLSLYANLVRPETIINIGVMLIPIIFLFVIF